MCINYYDYTAYFKTFGENQKFEAIIGPQHKPLQVYKGNSEKYKGNFKKYDFSICSPKPNIVICLRQLAALLMF